jgi:SAM-dependent methyltransferase
MDRRDKILSCINPASQKGLEIGALDRPMVTRDMGTIKYVDYTTTAELKRTYTRRNPNRMVEVDYVWGDIRLDELVENEFPFDYVIASHVLEHVPNLIGWLNEVSGTLRPGGYLSLALPDKNQCFDYLRRETAIADVIDAHLRKEVKPSPKAIFESKSLAVSFNKKISWPEKVKDKSKLTRIFNLRHAWGIARNAYESGTYYDSHCWVFTPQSIFELFRALTELDLFDFSVNTFFLTSGCEFFITLQKLDPANKTAENKEIQMNSIPVLERLEPLNALEQELERTKKELADAKATIATLQQNSKEAIRI